MLRPLGYDENFDWEAAGEEIPSDLSFFGF